MRYIGMILIVLISGSIFYWLDGFTKNIAWIGASVSERSSSVLEVNERETIPSTFIMAVDSAKIDLKELPRRSFPMVLIYFDPYCPVCHQQIMEIIKHKDELRRINFFLITPFPFYQMIKTYRDFKLISFQNIKIGWDIEHRLSRIYSIDKVPSAIFFDKEGRLINRIIGFVGYKRILSEINN